MGGGSYRYNGITVSFPTGTDLLLRRPFVVVCYIRSTTRVAGETDFERSRVKIEIRIVFAREECRGTSDEG